MGSDGIIYRKARPYFWSVLALCGVMLAAEQWYLYHRAREGEALASHLFGWAVVMLAIALSLAVFFRRFVREAVTPVEALLQGMLLPAESLSAGPGRQGADWRSLAEAAQALRDNCREAKEKEKRLGAYEALMRRGVLRMLERERERRRWQETVAQELERSSRHVLACAGWMRDLPSSTQKEALVEGYEEILEAGRHLQFVARSLLFHGRAREAVDNPAAMPMRGVVEEAVALLMASFERRSIDFRHELCGGHIMMDPLAALHALWGALSLALRFAAPEAAISLRSMPEGEGALWLRIEVSRYAYEGAHDAASPEKGLFAVHEGRFQALETCRKLLNALVIRSFLDRREDACRVLSHGRSGFLLELRFPAAPLSLAC